MVKDSYGPTIRLDEFADSWAINSGNLIPEAKRDLVKFLNSSALFVHEELEIIAYEEENIFPSGKGSKKNFPNPTVSTKNKGKLG